MRSLCMLGFLAGCALPVSDFGPVTTGTTGTTAVDAGTRPTTNETTTDTTSSDEGPATSSTGNPFDLPPLPDQPACDPYVPMSCPEGQKCVWTDLSEFDEVDALACIPEPRSPIPAGAPCPPNPDLNGIDDCVAGSACMPYGSLDETWTCTTLCQGDFEHPYCGPMQVCITTRTIAWCEDLCSPLVQDCPESGVCEVSGVATFCAPLEQGSYSGAPGSICEYSSDCAPASTCAAAEDIPGCDGAACCTPLCSIGEDAVACDSPKLECRPIILNGEPTLFIGLGVCLAPGADP